MRPASILGKVQGNDRRGFTLIELMAAMVVVAIGLFAVIQLQLVSIRGNSYAQERSNAQEIANGVAEEIMTQSLEWANVRPGDNTQFGNVFSLPNTTIVANMSPIAMGVPIPYTNMLPLTQYRGNNISSGASALLINTAGCSSSSGATLECQNLGSAGQLYRVYYIAEAVPLTRGAPAPNPPQVVRITVFVTWDNKDHGQNYDWNTIDTTSFWSRHMVAVTFFLGKTQFF